MPRRDTAQLAQQDDPYRNPNFQRRWDHSPYSFRADWAESLPVGKQLETLGVSCERHGAPAGRIADDRRADPGHAACHQVRRVVIAADADALGECAARAAALRWHREGRQVRIARPDVAGQDFNDILLARRPAPEWAHG